MNKIVIICIVCGISICSLYSQNKTIIGRVMAEDFDIVPGVSIMIEDTINVGRTDLDGFFEVEIPISEKTILFRGIGVESTTIELLDNCNKVELVIMCTTFYSTSLRRANRHRKRRYKKLPKIHKQAFEEDIFETEYACYEQKFKPSLGIPK